MNKRLISSAAAFILAFSLAGCHIPAVNQGSGSTTGGQAQAAAPEGMTSNTQAAAPEGGSLNTQGKTPGAEGSGIIGKDAATWYDSDLQQVVMNHPEITLEDDFHMAVNRDWLTSTVLPDGYSSYDAMTERMMEVDGQLAELLEHPTAEKDSEVAHDRMLVQKYYDMWMDWDSRNELGVEPLRERLEPLMKADSLDELTEYLHRRETVISATELIQCDVSMDWNNADDYAVYIMPIELIFGDSYYYRMMTEDDMLSEPYYVVVIRHILVEMGYSDDEAMQILKGCFAFEKDIADYIMTTEEENARDAVEKENNVRTLDQLEAEAGDFPIRTILEAYGADKAESYILTQPAWLQAMDVLYTEEYMEYLKDYLICYTAQDYATLLDRDTYDTYYDVINGISGANGTIADIKAATDAVNTFLPMQMGRVYAEHYVTDDTKQEVTALTREIIDEYREMLLEETFLTPATRQEAINKLNHITLRIAKPDKWEDDSRLDFDGPGEGGNLLKAQDQVGAYWVERMNRRIGQKVDRNIWTSKIQQVNAFYDPSQNTITICGGILGGSLYNNNMTREELLATVGDTIGHEISHAFDTTGSQFDELGNIRNWWTQEDREAFSARADKLVAYYNNIEPMEDQFCNGSQIEGEAIADLVGMKILLRIAKQDDSFDYDKFFRSFAATWRTITTMQSEFHILMQDNHPLPYLRVNAVVQQFDEFYDTFGIMPGDGMYLAPEQRLEVW